ncbi:hypothetical protein DPMN_133620 [Dreissena polymorpha]|uniref:Uncharacterized protein n=1 Tax=Dreissena polymorpha TaxID=45954 RepID=A0A9D4FYN9_DREPO|nr:hypothetical protein DPMN_133620 [Dreissena polymorpha]
MQYCSTKCKCARFDIVKEETPLQRSEHKGVDGVTCVSMQDFTKVSMGDKVWLRCTYSTSEIYQYDQISNSFATMLINI